MRYKVGDKVVPRQGLEAAPYWFSDNYVTVSHVGEFDYTVKSCCLLDYSFIADAEIDKESTEKLNNIIK